MEEVYQNLWVGSDKDFLKAKAKNFAIVSACKDGEYGHRATLGYVTHAAPKGKDYLVVNRPNHLVLNIIDPDERGFIPDEPIDAALAFIDKELKAGRKVLVHCNRGESRAPSIVLLYLRKIRELPETFKAGFKMMKTFYPDYDPNNGMMFYVRHKYHKV